MLKTLEPMRRQEGHNGLFLAVLRKRDGACSLHIAQPFALLKVRLEYQSCTPVARAALSLSLEGTGQYKPRLRQLAWGGRDYLRGI